MKNNNEEVRFKVAGAGELILGTGINTVCGGLIGFHLGVTWGNHGESGGVIDREDAKRLADFILITLENQQSKTHEEVMEVFFKTAP